MSPRAEYLSRFASLSEAIEFERRALSGSDLPDYAIAVRDGGNATDEYWVLLISMHHVDSLPVDDEPLTPEEVASLDAARGDPRRYTTEEMLRELGIRDEDQDGGEASHP